MKKKLVLSLGSNLGNRYAYLLMAIQKIIQSYALSLDKFLAFFFATALSATATFIGQKYWLFKQKN